MTYTIEIHDENGTRCRWKSETRLEPGYQEDLEWGGACREVNYARSRGRTIKATYSKDGRVLKEYPEPNKERIYFKGWLS